jgi:hypothetical protein
MAEIGFAIGLIAVAGIAFGLSIGVGILVGRRMDRFIETRAAQAQAETAGTAQDEEVGAHGG